MVYATIEEAWGNVSGSNFLSTPLKNNLHPIQKKRYEEEQKQKYFQCKFKGENCNDVFKRNKIFNEQKKMVAEGLQQFPVGIPGPHNYVFLPQYPWHPWAKSGYLQYGPQISAMFYNNPFTYYPKISQDLYNYQQKHPEYIEYFSEEKCNHCNDLYLLDRKNIRTGITFFIFFLISLAVVLCVIMLFSIF